MKSYIEHGWLVVAVTHSEACSLNDGTTIHDRRNPLDADAKIQVQPYGEYDPDYKPLPVLSGEAYDERLRQMRCVAEFFSNNDLVISVLSEVSGNASFAAEPIERDVVITMQQGEERRSLLSVLPPNGVMIRFDSDS